MSDKSNELVWMKNSHGVVHRINPAKVAGVMAIPNGKAWKKMTPKQVEKHLDDHAKALEEADAVDDETTGTDGEGDESETTEPEGDGNEE